MTRKTFIILLFFISSYFILSIYLLYFSIGLVFSDQTAISNYDKSRSIFWDKLYKGGGFTLYCGQKFRNSKGLNIEHVYPASWMGEHLGCGSRKNCRKVSDRFNLMEADLHNLYPSIDKVNKLRSNFYFGIIEGEVPLVLNNKNRKGKPKTCDFEYDRKAKLAEPWPPARGNIARSIFYMNREYGLPISGKMVKFLKEWNLSDPPSPEEKRRNNLIEELQGTRNIFIDNYKDCYSLECSQE